MAPAVSATNRARCFAGLGCLLLVATALGAELRDVPPVGLPSHPNDPRTLCLRGDSAFRNADFELARRWYGQAAEIDPTSARAHWGLGRVARTQFQRKLARDYFDTA